VSGELPQSTDNVLMLRPLGGTSDEITGICTPWPVAPLPSSRPTQVGDHRSSRLLRDRSHLRRAGAGRFMLCPHRGRTALPARAAVAGADRVQRLLIADDVGIGKRCAIARELLDRGEIGAPLFSARRTLPSSGKPRCRRSSMRKWSPGTAARLGGTAGWRILFERLPHVLVSTDFIRATGARGFYAPAQGSSSSAGPTPAPSFEGAAGATSDISS
jgi:hypothetical protein